MSAEAIRLELRTALALLTTFVLQVGLLDGLRISGRAPEVLLVLAVAGGLVGGWSRGLKFGLAAGLLYDLVAGTPLGLAAFAYALVAAASGLLVGYTVRTWWLVPPFVALGLSLYVFAGEILGQDHLFGDGYLLTLGVVVLWSVILALPAGWLMRWAWGNRSQAPAPLALGSALGKKTGP